MKAGPIVRQVSTFRSSSALKKPVFDIKTLLARQNEMAHSIERRNEGSQQSLAFIVKNRPKELALAEERNRMAAERRVMGYALARLAKESPDSPEKAEFQAQLQEYKAKLSEVEERLAKLSEEIHNAVESLPNWLSPRVPLDPHNAEVVEFINGESESQIELSFLSTESHRTIGERLGLIEFETAARISGSSWYYLVNDGALLEQALVQYALSRARAKGYKMVIPPSIVKDEVVHASGFKPRDQNGEKQVYALQGEGLSLTGTAEIPLGALHSNSVIETPIKYVGVSRSYRAEAGSRGRNTVGLYRVHEFTKVELYHFTNAELSDQELDELKDFQVSIIRDLGLKAKMLNMPTTDLGAPAMRKYDCEAWMPGRNSWGELTSSSNCGEYQARRLGIRRKAPLGNLEYVHTLNGTAMAVPRVIVAILEQFHDPETKTVMIPEVLRPFMDGKERITACK